MEDNKIKELNKEYDKYSQAVVKVLNSALKEGERYVFIKLKNDGYGMVISRERDSILNVSHKASCSKLLDAIDEAIFI